MTMIKDLERCDFFPLQCDNLISIGWLSLNSDYTVGSVDKQFVDKLCELVVNPWEPVVSGGWHECDLCQFYPPKFKKNVFIPYDGFIYVTPEAITHYICQHWYQPPVVFVNAVMACPSMNSMDYKKAILANGGRRLVKFRNQSIE